MSPCEAIHPLDRKRLSASLGPAEPGHEPVTQRNPEKSVNSPTRHGASAGREPSSGIPWTFEIRSSTGPPTTTARSELAVAPPGGAARPGRGLPVPASRQRPRARRLDLALPSAGRALTVLNGRRTPATDASFDDSARASMHSRWTTSSWQRGRRVSRLAPRVTGASGLGSRAQPRRSHSRQPPTATRHSRSRRGSRPGPSAHPQAECGWRRQHVPRHADHRSVGPTIAASSS
jgi:hypothetical protein